MARTVLGILLVATMVACGAPADEVRVEQAQAAAGQQPGHGAGDEGAGGQTAPDAVELRTTLEKLLGHHATLVVRLTRAELRRDPDFLQAATAALEDNTRDLTAAVESVYGPEDASTFERLWVDHTRAFFLYSSGLASGDQAARTEAERAFDRYRRDFGAFVESATGGELQAAAVSEALRAHIDLLLRQADAYAAEDYATAYELQREAYGHMFPVGTTLAGGFASHTPAEFPVAIDTAPQQLRSALGKLFGEHVELAVDVMRSGVTGAADFEQAAAALDANTSDITQAVEGLFGADGARQFAQLWPTHIDLLVDYTVGLAEDDAAARERALAGLRRFERGLGDFLSRAAGGTIEAQELSQAVLAHDSHLIEQIDAYASEDYETAHRISYDAYQHMFDVAGALATAIEAAGTASIPSGGVQTGGGGSWTGRH